MDRLACRARYGLDPQRTIFLFVGRVDKEKRVDVLLRAIHLLQRDDIQLVVAGRGAALGEFQALAKSLKLGERVRFTGFIPNEDLPMLLNSIDIFTMPSEAELLSIASLEAMACARPVLLADAVALPELVTQGVNGYLFKPGDAEDAARYMRLLADQRDRWEQMGKASLERARAHSLELTIQRFESLYQNSMK
jgi:glycosyltransferase involved in cell wall biosynthesis